MTIKERQKLIEENKKAIRNTELLIARLKEQMNENKVE